ncbi:TPA: hypothetical protein ACGG8F_003676, partial [Vibrio cholerae]
MTQNSNTTTETTAAHWDWKRRALTVPLEAFVNWPVLMIFTALLTNTKKITLLFVWCFHISGWFSEHEKS